MGLRVEGGARSVACTAPHPHPAHYEIWKYYQSTGKVHAEVLENLIVRLVMIVMSSLCSLFFLGG